MFINITTFRGKKLLTIYICSPNFDSLSLDKIFSIFFFSKDRDLGYTKPPLLKMNLADVSCKLAKLFVSAGADLNALNKEGQTPLMVAVLQVYTSFVL